MSVTPTIQNVKPVVGGSADTWGGTLNDRIGETYVDINALAVQGNASEAAVVAALPKAGGTMTGDVALADVAPTNALSVGFRGLPVVSIDTDRVFGLTDSGKMIRLTGTTARNWTIPPVASVGFPVGTAIVVRNFGTQPVTLTRGAAVQLRIPGSTADANRTLSPSGQATLVMEASNIWVVSGAGVA